MASAVFRSLIIGPPGSGKGTISSRIVKNFNLKYLASGDLLRSHILRGTADGKEIKKYIEKGSLVPDDVVTRLILKEVEKLSYCNWLLDGFPRTVCQAEALSQTVGITCALNLDVPDEVIIDRLKGRWLHAPSGRIYHDEFNPPKITVSRNWLFSHYESWASLNRRDAMMNLKHLRSYWQGKDDITGEDLIQRDDDKPETVRIRLENYKKQTRPVLDYYRKQNLLTEFHGKESNEIWPRVKDYIETITSDKKHNLGQHI